MISIQPRIGSPPACGAMCGCVSWCGSRAAAMGRSQGGQAPHYPVVASDAEDRGFGTPGVDVFACDRSRPARIVFDQ